MAPQIDQHRELIRPNLIGNLGIAVTLDPVPGAAGLEAFCGGDGNDTITAGAGADVINGGAGNDTFVYLLIGALS